MPVRLVERYVLPQAALFLLVATFVSFYGQLDRKQSADTYATVYTAVAVVRDASFRLDRYLPIIQVRSGERPGQLDRGEDGHLYSHFPVAPAFFGVPAVAVLAAAGVSPENWGAHMEAGFLSGALATAMAVALFFLLLTRLTTRPRALVAAAVLAWATPVWTIAGQGLWQHGPALLALAGALLAIVSRRPVPAGFALASMVVFRPSTVVLAALLLPLFVPRPRALALGALGALPPAAFLAAYNWTVFGSPLSTGYGDVTGEAGFSGSLLEGLSGNLVAPGRGIFVYAPVLLVAVAGAVLGRRLPLYRWAALALVAHVLFVARWFEWWGGEAFGPRQLVDALPLFALLLVPALDRWAASPRFRRLFAALAAWSVAVHLLGAALWPGTGWYDSHAVREFGTWWSLTDTELTALFSDPGRLLARGGLMALVVLGALAAGLLAALVAEAWSSRRGVRARAPALPPAR